MDPSLVLKKIPRLRVDRNPNRYTVGKAPHKPILLLALIVLNKNKRINLSDIKPSLDLRETWEDLWGSLSYDRIGPIYLPMYHLKSDGFWKVELKPNHSPHQPKSLNELMGMSDRISLDEDLVQSLEDPDFTSKMINAILHGGYFSEEEIGRLRDLLGTLDVSFRYQDRIVEEKF